MARTPARAAWTGLALSVAILGYWLRDVIGDPVRSAIWLVGCTLAWLSFWLMRRGFRGDSTAAWLSWTGLRWVLEPVDVASPSATAEGFEVRCAVMIDLQRTMLVRVRPLQAARARWLWLEQRQAPGSWHALRCALFAGVDAATAVETKAARGTT